MSPFALSRPEPQSSLGLGRQPCLFLVSPQSGNLSRGACLKKHSQGSLANALSCSVFGYSFFFFFFFSKEPSSGLCLGHPATGTLRHPRTRPQVACSKYTQRVLHREGMGWPAEDGMRVSRAPWSADLRVTPATLLASVDVSPLQHSDPPSPVRQNPRALGGKGRPRHFIS